MAATSADRRKVAALGAGRGDWLCIGTSLDALGARGRVTAPGPDLFRSWFSRSARASLGHRPPAVAEPGRLVRPPWCVIAVRQGHGVCWPTDREYEFPPDRQQGSEQEKGAEMARRGSDLAGSSSARRTGGGGAVARPRDGVIAGYLLKLLRQSAGLSQEALADLTGRPPTTRANGGQPITQAGSRLRAAHNRCETCNPRKSRRSPWRYPVWR